MPPESDVAAMFPAAREHQAAKRWHEAEVLLRRILTDDPSCAEAWWRLAMIGMEAKQYPIAEQYARRAIELAPGSADGYFRLGLIFQAKADWRAAEESFRKAVELAPDRIEAIQHLGECLLNQDRAAEALAFFERALRVRPNSDDMQLLRALCCQRLGQPDEAARAFQAVVGRLPDRAELVFGWGQLLAEIGQIDESIDCLQRALKLRPTYPEALNQLGIVLARAGRNDESQAAFCKAVEINPGFASALNNLANVYRRLGRWDDAERAMLRAVSISPDDADLHMNLALAHEQAGQLAAARISLENVIRIDPKRAEAYRILGRVLNELGQMNEAQTALERSLELRPADAKTANELASLFQEADRFDDAERVYRQALAADANFGPAHGNLGYLLADQGRVAEARQAYDRALQLGPSNLLRLAAVTMLPPIVHSTDEIRDCRRMLAGNLARLYADGLRVDPSVDALPTLFYLAYHGENDRDFQAALAKFGESSAPVVSPAARSGGAKIHVGFLSRNFKNHTIGGLQAGMIERLDRSKVIVTVLSVGRHDDTTGRRIRESADRFVLVPTHLLSAVKSIAAQGLDILYCCDIGMDPFTYTLAHHRLAPVQCVTWGHPITTGLPTMDYFLSSENLEIESADEHYTERLVRLSELSTYYQQPPASAERGKTFFDFPPNTHIYGCPQTLFKFHPDFDAVLAAILRHDPAGILVLLEGRYPVWRELLTKRFERTMPDVCNRIRFVPRQSREGYMGLLSVTDVLLDPLHFGGGNSSYEGLTLGVPIVTLPSSFLRGRITYALYRQMGLMDCVVETPDEYVRLAVELGTNIDRRRQLQRAIGEASPVILNRDAAVRSVENFFERAFTERRSAS
jgi:predicted O-linked N-acetylglucosamine transferase (SPINDLY family)